MRFRSPVLVFALTLACAVMSCGSPQAAPPPADTSPPLPAPPPYYMISEGPAQSGADVRLSWITTDGGARVMEGLPVFAYQLTMAYRQRIDCVFGPHTQPFEPRIPCVPSWPSAIPDTVGNLFADAACTQRLTYEDKALRGCQPPLKLAVLVSPGSDACRPAVTVREVEQAPTPTAPFVSAGGRCQPGPAGKDSLLYYKLGRELLPGEIPWGNRAVEATAP